MKGTNVVLGNLSMDMATEENHIAFTVKLNDKILHTQEIISGRVEQVAAVMTLLASGIMSQDMADQYLKAINSK